MTTRKEICDKALEYLDTPFIHQGRLKGIGVDCAGLIIEVAKELGIYKTGDIQGYSRIPDGKQLFLTLKNNTKKEKNINELKEGDIILMRFLNEPQHVGIFMPNNQIIHSYQKIGKVTIHHYNQVWRERTITCFEFPNVED